MVAEVVVVKLEVVWCDGGEVVVEEGGEEGEVVVEVGVRGWEERKGVVDELGDPLVLLLEVVSSSCWAGEEVAGEALVLEGLESAAESCE